jgi:hypothetical protein
MPPFQIDLMPKFVVLGGGPKQKAYITESPNTATDTAKNNLGLNT